MRSFSIKAALAALLMSTSIAGAHTASPLPAAQTHAAQTHPKLNLLKKKAHASHRRLSRGVDTTRTASKSAPHLARKHDLPKSEAYPNRDWFPMAAEFNQGINGL